VRTLISAGMYTEAFPIVTVPALEPVLAFYVGLLGFRQTYAFPAKGTPEFVVLRLDNSDLGLGVDPAARPAAALELCVYADDCDRAIEQLRAAGTPVVEEPSDQRWGERMARVLDPAGNRVMVLARA
jgi:lactoylglutathione lyase